LRFCGTPSDDQEFNEWCKSDTLTLIEAIRSSARVNTGEPGLR
jgi:hypothetical protein